MINVPGQEAFSLHKDIMISGRCVISVSAHRISLDCRREDIDSMDSQMENLELEKAKAKSNLCLTQNNLLLLTEGHELPSRTEILDTSGSLDKWSESAIEILSNLFQRQSTG